ncbi:hypothetical protein BBUCA112A_D0019 (plasmid) [Borreliella burgdorferi CA-11.2A]|nr:hypothetical protein BBUCA112A_D0019 [Borreliella burgdorferi CA-11.2A]
MLFTYIKSIVIYRPYFKNFFTLGTFNIFSYSSYIYTCISIKKTLKNSYLPTKLKFFKIRL